MKQGSRPIHKRDGFEFLAFYLLAAMLLFAPLIKGGNRPLPLLMLELAAVLLLAFPMARPIFRQQLSTGLLLGLALLMLLPLLQLLPMPFSMWQTLPGRDVYAGALTAFGTTSNTHPLSLLPMATEVALLALLPPVAVFLAAVSLPENALRKCVYLFIAIATAQAVYALVQFGGGATTTFRTSLADIGTGVGTYVNRNHLAGMLAMALPLSLGLLASRVGHAGEQLRYRSKSLLRRMAGSLNPARLNQTLIFSAISIVILLGAIFSRSRTGIMLAMLGIFLTAVLYGFRIGGRRSTNLVTVLSVIGLALAVEVGLAPVLERFSAEALEDARWSIFGSSITALGQFFPFGSGLGTFPDIYRRFQPAEIDLFVNHAHNDYIEYLFEGGLMAAVVILLFLFAYVRAWPRLLRLQRWGTLSFMQAGAGIGLLLMALHGLTDYNWHIPANAIYFALMAGVFLHRGETPREARPHAHRAPAEAPAASLPVVRTSARNPFAE
jgi:O-antigen ligase